MPVTFLHAILGIGFVLVWLFIGAMIFGDVKFIVRGERESGQEAASRKYLASRDSRIKPTGRPTTHQRSSAA